MIYKRFQDIQLSALGFGTMRLPIKNGVYSDIDEQAAAEMFDYAIKNGVNYFDTAWGCHRQVAVKVFAQQVLSCK